MRRRLELVPAWRRKHVCSGCDTDDAVICSGIVSLSSSWRDRHGTCHRCPAFDVVSATVDQSLLCGPLGGANQHNPV